MGSDDGREMARRLAAWPARDGGRPVGAVILAGIAAYQASSGNIPQASSVYWQDFALKKLGHATFYGALAILFYRALKAHGIVKNKALFWAIILSILYGVSDEVHQHFTQGRESRVRDVGFDALGAVLAMHFVAKLLPVMPESVVSLGKKLEII